MAKNRPCPCSVVCARGFGRGVEAAGLRGELRGAHVFHRRRHVSAAARARRSARRGKRRGLLCPVPPGARRSATRRGVRLLGGGDPRWIDAGVRGRLAAGQPAVVPGGGGSRHRGGHHAGPRAAGDDRDAAAAHVPDEPGGRHDHARRHLLRRQVRRVDDLDPAERSGESASVVTCLDGYQMARQGRAGAALGIAAIASFIAGTVGVLGLMLVAPPLAKVALSFSSPEYFALMALGLAMVVLLAGRSMVKRLLAMLCGLWIAGIGTDLFSTTSRFTFGRMELLSGVDFVVVAIGVFAICAVLANMGAREETRLLSVPTGLRKLPPSLSDLQSLRFAFSIGSVLGIH